MKEHIDPKRAARKALVQHSVNEVDRVVDALVAVAPHLAGGLYLAKSLVGYAMVRRQEELNQLVEFISDHPEEFRKELMDSREFQDAFVLSLESYIRLRSETKRFLARQILLGLAASPNRQDFPLERLQDTLAKISEPTLHFIAFVESVIPERRRIHIEKQVDGSNLGDKSREWWIANHDKSRAISKDIELYIHEMYNPNSSKVKNELNSGNDLEGEKLTRAFEVEQAEREKIYDAMSELVQLGVMATSAPPPTFDGGGGNDYRFTKFGFKFIEYVKNSDFSQLFA